ncbi:MAG TPA: YeeE/YedE thiosulfate transporter family protein [Methanocorpusculum sp.]|nr:YeeE/YedE thiosulfate transporter family protein [Methanocorpusculum sp.]
MPKTLANKGIDKALKRPWVAGVIIGLGAAFMQFIFFISGSGNAPVAYGFCVACHTRDLFDTIWNGIFGTTLGMGGVSKTAVAAIGLPVLTILGVLLGALIAALIYKEFRFKKTSVGSCIKYLIGGFFFMVCALLMGACPYRIALRLGYGDMVALIGLAAIVIGVFIGVQIALKKVGGK